MNMIGRSARASGRHRQRHGRHAHGRRVVEARTRAATDITVFGAEPHVNYNRIMLSSVLAGDKSVDDIVINPRLVRRKRHHADRRRCRRRKSTAATGR